MHTRTPERSPDPRGVVGDPTAMTTQTAPAQTPDPGGAVASDRASAPTVPASTRWLRRSIVALAVVTAVMVATGLYLTFRYRPARRVDDPRLPDRTTLVALAQWLHTVGAYAFVVLVCITVATALVVANRRHHAPGIILASGFGLFLVAIGFLVTGLQLPWQGFRWAATSVTAFDGVFGFPRAVADVLVRNDEVTPARYETVAWIHIAGLPVFAVFAAWWLLGAIQASRPGEAGPQPDDATGVGPTRATAVPPSEPEAAARPVTLAEQFFGTDDPGTVRQQVDGFLTRHLGTGIAALDFTRVGSGIILGVTLADGRPAVVRFFGPGTDAAYLRSVQEVALTLVAQGFPAPRPLLEPTPFGVGLATVEGRLYEPPPADPDDPAVRRALAEGLASFVRLAAPLHPHADLAGRGPLGPPAPGSAFPAPAGTAFDLASTALGAEWIEEIGARARAILEAAPPSVPVVGHFGWRVESVAVLEGQVVGCFDWTQVGTASEAVVLGSATHQFTIDGRSARPHVPTPDEIRQFVTDYETARGVPLTTPERVAARAAYVYCTAYGARCEHALAVTGQAAPGRFRERLAATGAALLS